MQIWIALALVGSVASGNIPEAPSWQFDYHAAKLRAKDVQKPLAVFVGSGEEGWSKISRDGKFDSQVNRLLLQKYVCIYADRSTPAGQRLAAAFEVSDSTGLVISDKSGSVQAFSHNGALTKSELVTALEKYGDPARPVQTTDTTNPLRYQPAPAFYQPQQLTIPYRSIGGG